MAKSPSISGKISERNPARKGLGIILQSAIERERKITEDGKSNRLKSTVLMNPTRRRIFEIVCRQPCLSLSECAKIAGLSINNTKWHIKKIVAAGYLSLGQYSNVNFIYPDELLEEDMKEIFACLSAGCCREILPYIIENGGVTGDNISNALSISTRRIRNVGVALERLGAIIRLRDGRYVRYYVTPALQDMRRRSVKKLRIFRVHLMKRFASEGLDPEVIRADGRALIVKLRSGRKKQVLNLQMGI